MFFVVDEDNSEEIDFSEFMQYIYLLLKGTKQDKNNYIFKMICGLDQ